MPDDNSSGTSPSVGKKEGFRVKQRKKTKPCIDGKERSNKVTVVTIDSKSAEEEQKIDSLTVEEVIKQSFDGRIGEKQNSGHDDIEKHSVTFSLGEQDGHHVQESYLNASKVSFSELNGNSDQRHPKVKPTQPTFSTKNKEVDLDIIGTLSVPNGQRPLSSESADTSPSYYSTKSPYMTKTNQGRTGSARSMRSSLKSGKSGQQKSLGSGSVVSMSGYRPNEAEYIQIATPVKNPYPSSPKKSSDYPQNEGSRGHMGYSGSGIREPVPSPELELNDTMEITNNPMTPAVEIKHMSKPSAPALSISIPTADFTDSALNSPTRVQGIESSPKMRRAKDMRDEQIDQITSLLVDAIIGPNDNNGNA